MQAVVGAAVKRRYTGAVALVEVERWKSGQMLAGGSNGKHLVAVAVGVQRQTGGAGGSGVVIIDAGTLPHQLQARQHLVGTIYTFTGSGSITF
jgi:hypothetical protein